MRSPRSLRFRLILAAAFWVVAAMIAAFFILSSIFRAHVTEQFYEELAVHVEELERLDALHTNSPETLHQRFSDPRYDVPLSGFYWEVRRPNGRNDSSASLQGRTIGAVPPAQENAGDILSHRVEGPTGPLLVTVLHHHHDRDAASYLVGTDERHLERAVSGFDSVLAWSLAGFGVVLVLSVAGFVVSGLAPFGSLAHAMRKIRSGEVRNIEGRYPSEVQPLVTELNSMIVGQQESLQRARAHAGNLAHGLKGPLAIIADEAFMLQQKGDEASGALITEQCRAMQLHIDHHIARTRAQAMARTPGTRSDVSKVVGGVVAALSRLHADRNIDLECEISPNLYTSLDEQDLNELAANLLDNAFKFAGSRIVLRAEALDGDSMRLIIDDDGPGLPPEARERVFMPGARLDESKPGSGLGLAIVRDLVELYRGNIALRESPLGGLRVSVNLPMP